jgi:hypothetical protein
MAELTWTRTHEDGSEEEVKLPFKWEICSTCDGHGQHSRDFGAITMDEWNGPDWDDDSREMYLRGGYDKSCGDCGGSGKVKSPDWDKMPQELADAYQRHLEEQAHYRAQEAHERKMGY